MLKLIEVEEKQMKVIINLSLYICDIHTPIISRILWHIIGRIVKKQSKNTD